MTFFDLTGGLEYRFCVFYQCFLFSLFFLGGGVHVLCHFPWSCYYCRICVDINSSSSEVISMLATIPCTRQGSTVTIERKWKFPPIFLSSLKVQDMKIFFRERWKKKCVCTIFFLIHLQPREKYLKSITLRKLFIIFLNSKNIGKFY